MTEQQIKELTDIRNNLSEAIESGNITLQKFHINRINKMLQNISEVASHATARCHINDDACNHCLYDRQCNDDISEYCIDNLDENEYFTDVTSSTFMFNDMTYHVAECNDEQPCSHCIARDIASQQLCKQCSDTLPYNKYLSNK